MEKMIITQTFTMARWQIVVKKSEATKQNKDQNSNSNNKQKHKGALNTEKNRPRENKLFKIKDKSYLQHLLP